MSPIGSGSFVIMSLYVFYKNVNHLHFLERGYNVCMLDNILIFANFKTGDDWVYFRKTNYSQINHYTKNYSGHAKNTLQFIRFFGEDRRGRHPYWHEYITK